jgi:hypothetical protein
LFSTRPLPGTTNERRTLGFHSGNWDLVLKEHHKNLRPQCCLREAKSSLQEKTPLRHNFRSSDCSHHDFSASINTMRIRISICPKASLTWRNFMPRQHQSTWHENVGAHDRIPCGRDIREHNTPIIKDLCWRIPELVGN